MQAKIGWANIVVGADSSARHLWLSSYNSGYLAAVVDRSPITVYRSPISETKDNTEVAD